MQDRVTCLRSRRLACWLAIAPLVACGTSSSPDSAISIDDIAVTTAEDTPITVMIPVETSDGTTVLPRIGDGLGHGAITAINTTWTYTPATDFHGTEHVTIVAEDPRGASFGRATATLTITVTPVNDPPVGENDRDGALSTTVGAALTIGSSALLANDHDVDGDAMSVTGVAAVAGGHGTPALRGSDVVFTPEAGFLGTAAFAYTLSDGQATTTAIVSIEVTEQPHAAPVVGNDTLTVDEAAEIAIDEAALLANDRDPEGLRLAITQVNSAVSSGKLVATITHSGGRIQIAPIGAFYGTASFSYVVGNGFRTSLALVTLTIRPRPLSTDVSLTLLSSAASVRAGGSLQYFLSVEVAGDHGVDITISDAFSPELTCRWTCEPSRDGTDTCMRQGTGALRDTVHLGPRGGVAYMVDCTVSAQTTATSIVNTASLALADWITDTTPGNNTASETVVVTR